MAMTKKWEDLKKNMSPEARARIDARVMETMASMPLAELRKAIGLTQAQLAAALDTGQGSVSKIENATDMYLSTLRRFVAALGGELILKASFPEGREFVIDHVSEVLHQEKSRTNERTA
jgi:transcriptional regulator with XRE-family HTH domain